MLPLILIPPPAVNMSCFVFSSLVTAWFSTGLVEVVLNAESTVTLEPPLTFKSILLALS